MRVFVVLSETTLDAISTQMQARERQFAPRAAERTSDRPLAQRDAIYGRSFRLDAETEVGL